MDLRLHICGFIAVAAFAAAKAQVIGAIEKPIWAKHATALDKSCLVRSKAISSPDGVSSATLLCHEPKGDDPGYSLRVVMGGHSYEVPLDEGAHELLWAPNSEAFFVDGGTSSYAGFFVTVYLLRVGGPPKKTAVTRVAQRDMVNTFPPCKAENRDEEDCHRVEADPEFNMSGIGWTKDSSAIKVFAEIPCSSSYGGIMCQIMGYEVSVSDGRVLRRISGHVAKNEWRADISWTVRIPNKPTYGAASLGR